MGGNGSMVKGLGAVGALASKLGHCGHGVRQRTLHTPGTRPLQHSTSEEKIRSAGRSQGAASKKINRERHPGNGSQVIEHGHREERREEGGAESRHCRSRCLIQTARQSSTTFYRKIMIRFCQIPLVSHLHAAILLPAKIYGAASLRWFLAAIGTFPMVS